VAVTAPNQVNLASTGLRLAKPTAVEHPPGEAGPDGGHASATAADTPLGASGAAPDAAPGTGPAGPELAKEQQVSFSSTKNLLGDVESADDLADLFKTVYQALDERQVSYGQGTLQLVVSAEVAINMAERLAALGITATVKPM
jgi:hypothetical protein